MAKQGTAGFNERKEDGAALSGFGFTDEQPVLFANGGGVASKAVARGMEQRIHENNVKNSKNGVANAQNPVGQNNKHKAEYKKASAPAWKKFRRK
jgi:hypothetical protein